MCRQLVLAAITCLSTAGCAKNTATVMGDPFLSSNPDVPVATEQTDAVANGRIPAIDNAGPFIGVDAPGGVQTRQTVFVDRDGQRDGDAETLAPAAMPPDQTEWWKTPASADVIARDGVQVPPSGSVQGRIGHASVSYGMGQISRP